MLIDRQLRDRHPRSHKKMIPLIESAVETQAPRLVDANLIRFTIFSRWLALTTSMHNIRYPLIPRNPVHKFLHPPTPNQILSAVSLFACAKVFKSTYGRVMAIDLILLQPVIWGFVSLYFESLEDKHLIFTFNWLFFFPHLYLMINLTPHSKETGDTWYRGKFDVCPLWRPIRRVHLPLSDMSFTSQNWRFLPVISLWGSILFFWSTCRKHHTP